MFYKKKRVYGLQKYITTNYDLQEKKKKLVVYKSVPTYIQK